MGTYMGFGGLSFLFLLFLIWLLPAIVGSSVLSRYNKAGIGFLLGLFLSWVGVIIALVIGSNESNRLQEAKTQAQQHQEQLRHQEQLMATLAARGGAAGGPAPTDPTSVPAGRRKFCSKCGTPIGEEDAFCGGCGFKLA